MSGESGDGKRYRSDVEIEELVERFESCTVPTAEFGHGAHLAVALWYLSALPDAAATERMRDGLRRYTTHNNAQAAYNETLTLFWLRLVRHFLDHADAGRPLAERANELIATYRSSQLAFEYYSRALVQTPEAKTSWVEPDLKPLDF
ncbi:MAG: hypothetical protein QOE47_2574 [Pyrinomonadaceae bacterium]|jgi:hypothetical protein|nr:hypothetical protein [Pyrinomonadaceae bacterium]